MPCLISKATTQHLRLVIMANWIMGLKVTIKDVKREGITGIDFSRRSEGFNKKDFDKISRIL